MFRSVTCISLVSIALAACGGGGDDGELLSAFPDKGFPGRKTTLVLIGEDTKFTASSTVDFGAGVTVGSMMSIGGTGLIVDITVAPDAALGPRSVTVDGLTLENAYTLEAPITTTVQGTLAQGSVVFLTIDNLDKLNPFDTTTDDDGNFVNVTLTGPAGIEIFANDVTATTIEAAAFIDVDAQPGTFSVASGVGEMLATSISESLAVAPRTAMALTANTPTMQMQTEAFGTQLFEFTPATGPVAITPRATTADADALPELLILGASGKFADGSQLLPVTFFGIPLLEGFVQKTPEKFYAIYIDRTGTTGYQYAVQPETVDLTAVAEQSGAHADNATAQAVTNNAMVDNGLLSAQDELDVYAISVGAGDVGKTVRVITGGDPLTDTVVRVTGGAAGTTDMGESFDLLIHEDFTSDPIPAGTTTVYVTITTSEDFFDPTHGSYIASIVIK